MFEKTLGVARKFGAKAAAAAVTLPVLVGSAYAELPAAVKTETDAFKADALAALGMIIGACIAVWGLKKLGSKMGWI